MDIVLTKTMADAIKKMEALPEPRRIVITDTSTKVEDGYHTHRVISGGCDPRSEQCETCEHYHHRYIHIELTFTEGTFSGARVNERHCGSIVKVWERVERLMSLPWEATRQQRRLA